MANSLGISLKGLESSKRILAEFPPKIARKVLDKATKAGARIVEKDARDLVKLRTDKKTGRLRTRKTGVQSKKQKRGIAGRGLVTTSNGVQLVQQYTVGWAIGSGNSPHGHLLELGHKVSSKAGDTGKETEPVDFLNDAFVRNQANVVRKMKQILKRGISEAAGNSFKKSKTTGSVVRLR